MSAVSVVFLFLIPVRVMSQITENSDFIGQIQCSFKDDTARMKKSAALVAIFSD